MEPTQAPHPSKDEETSESSLICASLDDNIRSKERNSQDPVFEMHLHEEANVNNEIEIFVKEPQESVERELENEVPTVKDMPITKNSSKPHSTGVEVASEETQESSSATASLADKNRCEEHSPPSTVIKAEPQDEANVTSNETKMSSPNEPHGNSEMVENVAKQVEICMETHEVRTIKQEPQNEVPIDKSIPIAQNSERHHPNQDEAAPEKSSENSLIPTPLDNVMGEKYNSCSTFIKAEPQDEINMASNEIGMLSANELQESSVMTDNFSKNTEIPMETNEDRTVIRESENYEGPISMDMPIAKDANYLSDTQFSTPVPTDDFLDGIATTIAPTRLPRLRVKSEFSLRENSSQDVSDKIPLPPPPPSLSSNSTSEHLADGIATPRISLLALNRLKVKTEFPQPDSKDEDSVLPAEFFNDLLEAKLPKEAGEISDSDSGTDFEDIPPDFFDDLLPDYINENIEQADNFEKEVKYSDRLKEKERLKNAYKASIEKVKDKRKHHKKQKKLKKKSRKRSRSPTHNKETDKRSVSPVLYNIDKKRRRRLCSSPDIHSSSKNCYKVEEFKRGDSIWASEALKLIKQEPENSRGYESTKASTLEDVEETDENLTPKRKKEIAVKRATTLLNHLRNSSSSDNFITSTFQFVSTIRKLPSSHFYVQQQIFENRSPLHTINNVSYKFNSHTARFNMEEWGLAALTPPAAKIARRIGCNAQFVYEKLKTLTIPMKLKKVKQENLDGEAVDEEGEELVEGSSSLFCNAMTQTDDDKSLHKGNGYDIGVQAVPCVFSIGSQTLETQLPAESLSKDDEAPIMNIIRDLNENQLVALHSFAEFIKEPARNTNAMDMYKVQMKMMEIYKISQIPSALSTPQNQVINNYSTTYNSSSQRRESKQLNPIIQSVKSADGTQFSISDPRPNSSAYTGRIINNYGNVNPGAMSANTGPRLNRSEKGNSQYSYRNSRPPVNESSSYPNQPLSSSYQQHQQFHLNQQSPAPSTSLKRYGRGALRR